MRVRGCCPRWLVFFGGQKLREFCGNRVPFRSSAYVSFKYSGERTPTGIAHQCCFFIARGIAVCCFNRFYEPDCCNIGMSLFMQAACTDAVRLGYAEVAGRLTFWFWFVKDDSSSAERCNCRTALSRADEYSIFFTAVSSHIRSLNCWPAPISSESFRCSCRNSISIIG